MKRTPTLIIVLLVLTVATAVLAVRKYDTQPVSATVKTTDYKALYASEAKQVKDLTNSNGILQATDSQLTTQKAHLCSVLSSKKLTDPLCN